MDKSNRIFLVCCSRGAAWALQMLIQFPSIADAAILIAGYPTSTNSDELQREAQTFLNRVNIPILHIHFSEDCFCCTRQYESWHAIFCRAMQASAAQFPEQIYCLVEGTHQDACALFQRGDYAKHANEDVRRWWETFGPSAIFCSTPRTRKRAWCADLLQDAFRFCCYRRRPKAQRKAYALASKLN